jgi:hypothetical protein
MAEINNSARKIIVAGVGFIAVNSKCSHHSIAIECATANTFTLKAQLSGSEFMTLADNEMSENSIANFILPGVEMIEVTPLNSAVAFVINVNSF